MNAAALDFYFFRDGTGCLLEATDDGYSTRLSAARRAEDATEVGDWALYMSCISLPFGEPYGKRSSLAGRVFAVFFPCIEIEIGRAHV